MFPGFTNDARWCSFSRECLFIMTYQRNEKSASISKLLNNKGKWYKEKGFEGMEVDGTVDADDG